MFGQWLLGNIVRRCYPASGVPRREVSDRPLWAATSPPRRRVPPEGHDPAGDQVHPAHAPPRAPARLPSHPALRFPRQSLPSAEFAECRRLAARARAAGGRARRPRHDRPSRPLQGTDRSLVAAVSLLFRSGACSPSKDSPDRGRRRPARIPHEEALRRLLPGSCGSLGRPELAELRLRLFVSVARRSCGPRPPTGPGREPPPATPHGTSDPRQCP